MTMRSKEGEAVIEGEWIVEKRANWTVPLISCPWNAVPLRTADIPPSRD
jgi:hypothetical protein